MREDIKKLNMYAANVFSTILAQNPNAISAPNRDRFITKSFEIAQRMMGLEERKTTLTVEIPDEGENGAARRVQEKLLRDIERSLGLKADAADPLTLAGRLDAIKRALVDQVDRPRGRKVDLELSVVDKITGWMHEGFKSYTLNNVNEKGHRIAFVRWGRLQKEVDKMARVIRDIGSEAWKDEENFPRPVSFIEEVARTAGVNMARSVNTGECDNPVKSSVCAKRALCVAVEYACPTGGLIIRLRKVVDSRYLC